MTTQWFVHGLDGCASVCQWLKGVQKIVLKHVKCALGF